MYVAEYQLLLINTYAVDICAQAWGRRRDLDSGHSGGR